MLDYRFRCAHRYSRNQGTISGFSTLEEGLVDKHYLEYQAVQIPAASGVHKSIAATELGNPNFSEIGEMFRAAHRYAASKGYVTGFPAFEQGRDGNNNLVYGTTLLKSNIVDVRSVPASELGSPSFSKIHLMFNSSHRYARNLNAGYVSGYPLFEQGQSAGILYYGIALVKKTAIFEHIPADVLAVHGGIGEGDYPSNITSGLIIFNNSDNKIYVKDEHTKEVKTVKPKSWAFGRFDGIAPWNQGKGRIAKCPDFNIAYIDREGGVRCFGPRKNKPYVGSEPYWYNSHTDSGLDNGWKDLDDAAQEFDGSSSSSSNPSSGHGRHNPDWDRRPDDGGVITDVPPKTIEEASRTV